MGFMFNLAFDIMAAVVEPFLSRANKLARAMRGLSIFP